jgi:hypothetical protein
MPQAASSYALPTANAPMVAGWNQKLNVLGVSTVAGNQTLEKVTRNALDVLDLAGLAHIGTHESRALPRPSVLHLPFGQTTQHLGQAPIILHLTGRFSLTLPAAKSHKSRLQTHRSGGCHRCRGWPG